MNNKELGIYIHIPFCKNKCNYCDFVSYTNKDEKCIKEYIEIIKKEILSYNIEKYNVTTIYIGGGTPSFIQSEYITDIMQLLKEKLKNNKTKLNDIEITIEINPGTVNEEKIQAYKKAGINRTSIGLQTTNDILLKQLGRIHNYEQFIDTYKMIQKNGIKNINVDLMIGLPNQKIEDVKKDLVEIKKLQPQHISVYSLIIEEGTKIEKLLNEKKIKLPNEELERQMYWYVKNNLELNEYNHYEISNFAKKAKESKHNMNCWEQKEYIGIGVAAHSYIDNIRYFNSKFEDTIKMLNVKFNNWNEIWNWENKKITETQSLEDKKREYMLLGLRKIEGVNISKFKQKYIDNPIYIYRKELDNLIEQKLIKIDGDYIKLTNKGIDFANVVWKEFV